MKSGQILSRNNSKTVLNIVFKFCTQVTVHLLFTKTSHSTMATGFGPLAEVTWTEVVFGTDPDRNRVLEKPPAAELIPT
jgi:hypothetical protein